MAERVGWAEVVKVERCDVEVVVQIAPCRVGFAKKMGGSCLGALLGDWTASGSASTREEGNWQTIALALALSDKSGRSGSFCLWLFSLSFCQQERQPQRIGANFWR